MKSAKEKEIGKRHNKNMIIFVSIFLGVSGIFFILLVVGCCWVKFGKDRIGDHNTIDHVVMFWK